jgi:plastocyanin
MDNGTLFYICGGALAASAVLLSVLGLKVKDFPGRLAPLVFLWFALLVGSATTFAVLHAQDEEHAKAAESSAESTKLEAQENEEVDSGGAAAAQGASTTLQLAASPTAIAYDTKSLSAKAGKVTIDFDNPSAIEHDVAIEQGGKEIAASDRVTQGKTSLSAQLAPGTYTFLCTVPGHAEAGMEGTLIVK